MTILAVLAERFYDKEEHKSEIEGLNEDLYNTYKILAESHYAFKVRFRAGLYDW